MRSIYLYKYLIISKDQPYSLRYVSNDPKQSRYEGNKKTITNEFIFINFLKNSHLNEGRDWVDPRNETGVSFSDDEKHHSRVQVPWASWTS